MLALDPRASMGPAVDPLVSLLLHTLLALVSTAVIWKGATMLESAAEALSRHYELPDMVQGAVVVAIGSSFPELSTTVISTLVHGEFELGVSAIVGSAIFNILVIPGLSGLFSRGPLEANRDVVYKEAQFYMLAVATLLLTFSFAAIYAPVDADSGAILGQVDRWLVLIPLGVYALYLWLQWQDTQDFQQATAAETKPASEPVAVGRQWLLLLASLALVVAGVEGLVRAALVYGEAFGTSTFLWGATVVAAGTSVPDAFVSIRAARAGKATLSVANVLGSNVFDLLVAIPAGVLIAGAAVINYSVAAPMMGVLILATLALFVFLRAGMELTKRECWALLGLYALFVVWLALESFALVDWVPSLPP